MFKIIWNHTSLRYHCHDQFLQMEILVLMQVFHLTTYVLAVCTYENKNLLRTLVGRVLILYFEKELRHSWCPQPKKIPQLENRLVVNGAVFVKSNALLRDLVRSP